MKAHPVIAYYQKEQSVIEKNLAKATELDFDALHDFRVAIKKLRTLFGYCGSSTRGRIPARILYLPFRKVFRTTGIIRDHQIRLIHLEEWTSKTELDLRPLIIRPKRAIRRNKISAEKFLDKFDKRVLTPTQAVIEKAFQNDHSDIVDEINRYEQKLIRKIKKITTQPELDFHRLRRVVKQHIYLQKLRPEPSAKQMNIWDIHQWKDLEKALGEWHDLFVFNQWVTECMEEEKLDQEQNKLYQDWLKVLTTNCKKLEKPIYSLLPHPD